MKTTLTIKPVNGDQFTVTGTNYTRRGDFHYINGASYPSCIVVDIEHEGENEKTT